MAAVRRQIGLGMVLACLASTLILGLAVKAPCASGDWSDGRQNTHFCYSDIEPLYGTEQLAGGRLPFLDPCSSAARGECDEYPVLTMYTMRVAAWASSAAGNDIAGFFYANVALLTIAAFVITLLLYLLVGSRVLYFVLAPTLLVYGFINWDLVAVALATAGTFAYLRRRDVWSGVFLGLGAAAKLYPALLVVPFVAGRLHERKPDAGIHLAWASIGTWLAVNAPFAIASPQGWWEFFRFNSTRSADWDSLWFLGCHRVTGNLYCLHTRAINIASVLIFGAVTLAVWRWKRRREPNFARWTLAFPILIVFLLSNKVYSPQYGLWLLPWFALTLPNLPLFLAFSAADVAVFLTRFSWFARYAGGSGGLPIGAFEIAVAVRAIVLVVCVIAWVRRREPVAGADPPIEPVAAEVAA
jgi:uncharacterized membrane protein